MLALGRGFAWLLPVCLALSTTAVVNAGTADDIIVNRGALSTFEDAIAIVDSSPTNAGLKALLDDPNQKLTVFAPKNDAFDDLDDDFLAFLLANPDILLKVLEYHIIPDESIRTRNMRFFDSVDTLYLDGDESLLLTQTITWTWRNGFRRHYFVNTAKIRNKDIKADNGYVHMIDKVLIPPDLLEVITFREGLVTLTSALVLAEMAEDLRAESNNVYTLFAPSNQAFRDLDEDVRNYLFRQNGNDALKEILQYHLVEGEVTAQDILDAGDGSTMMTLQGEYLSFGTMPGVFINEDTEVTETDIPAVNGIIHIIDTVLIPSGVQMDVPTQDIVDIVVERHELATLEVAIATAPGMTDDLKEDGPFTLFGPDNAAFDAVDNLGDILADADGELTDLLNHHVVFGYYTSETLLDLDGVSLLTLNGDFIEIEVGADDSIRVDGALVTGPDNYGTNGVVHVIDTVLELEEEDDEDECPFSSSFICGLLGY